MNAINECRSIHTRPCITLGAASLETARAENRNEYCDKQGIRCTENGQAGFLKLIGARAVRAAALRARLGAAQLGASDVVVEKLVDGWLADLESILGGVTGEVDPRFVEGVLVEVKRS